MYFSQKFQKKRYIFVKFIGFLAVSRIEGCFHWPSSPIRSGVMADPSFLGKKVAGAGLKRVCPVWDKNIILKQTVKCNFSIIRKKTALLSKDPLQAQKFTTNIFDRGVTSGTSSAHFLFFRGWMKKSREFWMRRNTSLALRLSLSALALTI